MRQEDGVRKAGCRGRSSCSAGNRTGVNNRFLEVEEGDERAADPPG